MGAVKSVVACGRFLHGVVVVVTVAFEYSMCLWLWCVIVDDAVKKK